MIKNHTCDARVKISPLSIHAEEHALLNFTPKHKRYKSRHKLKMYVIRTLSDSTLGMSKPCDDCIDKMRKFGIRKVIYSDKDGTIVTENIKNLRGEYSSGYKSVMMCKQILKTTNHN